MVKLGDFEFINQLYHYMDYILVPIYILAHTYFLYGPYWSAFASVIYVIGLIYFELIFVALLFASFFLSELLINQRIMRTASANIRNYTTVALTLIILIFLITLVTGAIEPYQGAIIFLVFYILQARYRTSTLTIAKISEIKEKNE